MLTLCVSQKQTEYIRPPSARHHRNQFGSLPSSTPCVKGSSNLTPSHRSNCSLGIVRKVSLLSAQTSFVYLKMAPVLDGQAGLRAVDGLLQTSYGHANTSYTHSSTSYNNFSRKFSVSVRKNRFFSSVPDTLSRRRMVAIRASAPADELVASATEPLTKKDLADFISSGCKPKQKWRIGTEHEKFGFDIKTLKPMSYEQIAQLLEGISERFNWRRLTENGLIIGLNQDGQSVSLEPGGQFELSGAPLETLHQTCAEVNSHLYQVKAVAEEMGLGFLGLGFHPKLSVKEIPIMPKGRYEIMRNYMPKVGSYGHDMMFRTCTVQVNLDFSSEQDMINKFRVGLALQPIATALFANSPFTEGRPNGFLSFRSEIWKDVDNNRTGMLPFVFDEDFGFEKYVDYALDVPMYFAYRNKRYVDCSGMSFRDFMGGKLPNLPGDKATLNDWENHLTTIFPEVRLKKFLEMRGADGGPWRKLCALPAFWVGLLYDETSLQGALEIIKDWTPEERLMLRRKVTSLGLKTPFRDGYLRHVAQDVVNLAKEGLQRRGYKETGFLSEIAEVVSTGITPAEKLLEKYKGEWKENVDPVFEELLY